MNFKQNFTQVIPLTTNTTGGKEKTEMYPILYAIFACSSPCLRIFHQAADICSLSNQYNLCRNDIFNNYFTAFRRRRTCPLQ